MKKKKKPLDFSKRIYIYNILLVSVIVIASFTLMFLSGRLAVIDLTPISVIIPSAFAELGLHTGFYIWKSKVENCRKFLSATEQLEQARLQMNMLANDVTCHENNTLFETNMQEGVRMEMEDGIYGNIPNTR
jgi:hypothetical protein